MLPRERLLFHWLTGAVAALAVAAAAGVLALVAGSPVPSAQLAARRLPVPPPPTTVAASGAPVAGAPVARPGYIATLSAPTPYHASPGGPVTGTLPAVNPFGAAEVVAVTEEQEVGPAMWLHVELPVRPNGTAAWIPADAVALTQTSYRVVVSLAARTLTVTDAGRPVMATSVAVGRPSTPTPPGRTYLWELVRPDDPTGPYGPYVFGLAEYSDAYSVFNGGDAQIGIHGQDEPWSIGRAASNGCVRVPNDVITSLAGMLPIGTPVTIS